ncbi:MAG: cyclase family protein [Planctomycetales bacterium]|nr:cyclase family protein [Planctomycetales bacterium]
MKRGGAAIAGLWAAATGCQAPAPPPDPLGALVRGEVEVVDLTYPLGPSTPLWPGSPPVAIEKVAGYESGYYANRLSTPEHAGTHVDAPAHFHEGTATVDLLRPEDLVAPAVVVDVSAPVAESADYRCTQADLERFEARHGRIPAGALVLLHTGWRARWPDGERYRNADAAGTMHFPGFSEEAVTFLVKNRDVRGIGLDTLSTDWGGSTAFGVHKILHAAGRYGLENLANLHLLPPTGAVVVVGVLPVEKGSGAPARVLALVPRGGAGRARLEGDPARLDPRAPPAGAGEGAGR